MMDFSAVLEALQARLAALIDGVVVIGTLPPAGGVSLVAAAGKVERYMDGSALVYWKISANAKAQSQIKALEYLGAASDVVLSPPDTDGVQVTGVSLVRPPAQLGMDTAGNFLFGSEYEIRAFYGGGINDVDQ